MTYYNNISTWGKHPANGIANEIQVVRKEA